MVKKKNRYTEEELAEKVRDFEILMEFEKAFVEIEKDLEELEEIRERIRKATDLDVPPTVH